MSFDDFIMQKVYFLRLMSVCDGVLVLTAYFVIPADHKWSINLLIEVDCRGFCIALRMVGAVLVVFLRRWRKICTILQPMGSKGDT